MAAMLRNCLLAAILWIVLAAAYAVVLAGRLPFPFAVAAGTIVWVGLVLIHGSRYALRDWQARNRMARGERPGDGDFVSAVGEIRPQVGEVLHAPFSGRECVLYAYDIGKVRNGESSARDYAGFAMTRCAVHTPYGSFQLGAFPAMEHVPRQYAEPEQLARFIAATTFEEFPGVTGVVKGMIALHTRKPPLRVDWQLGTPGANPTLGEERVIESGATVTVLGRYEATSNTIVSDAKEKGFLRLRTGGRAREVSAFPGEFATKLLAGLVIAIAPNALLWWWLFVVTR
jgi:hypothetical protein